mmetsp:Transcript_2127/g.6335  ORF Transcript_2127/g.6335 Transcript_2127/m.6335 type:complete len:337 (-) Transcript_2127:402-1412(-)
MRQLQALHFPHCDLQPQMLLLLISLLPLSWRLRIGHTHGFLRLLVMVVLHRTLQQQLLLLVLLLLLALHEGQPAGAVRQAVPPQRLLIRLLLQRLRQQQRRQRPCRLARHAWPRAAAAAAAAGQLGVLLGAGGHLLQSCLGPHGPLVLALRLLVVQPPLLHYVVQPRLQLLLRHCRLLLSCELLHHVQAVVEPLPRRLTLLRIPMLVLVLLLLDPTVVGAHGVHLERLPSSHLVHKLVLRDRSRAMRAGRPDGQHTQLMGGHVLEGRHGEVGVLLCQRLEVVLLRGCAPRLGRPQQQVPGAVMLVGQSLPQLEVHTGHQLPFRLELPRVARLPGVT